jgi:hypothetical protein
MLRSSPTRTLPGFEGDAFSTPKVIKDGTQTLVAVRRQLQSLLNGIDEPAKEHFRSAPAAVTFLFKRSFLMEIDSWKAWEGSRGRMTSSMVWNRIR